MTNPEPLSEHYIMQMVDAIVLEEDMAGTLVADVVIDEPQHYTFDPDLITEEDSEA